MFWSTSIFRRMSTGTAPVTSALPFDCLIELCSSLRKGHSKPFPLGERAACGHQGSLSGIWPRKSPSGYYLGEKFPQCFDPVLLYFCGCVKMTIFKHFLSVTCETVGDSCDCQVTGTGNSKKNVAHGWCDDIILIGPVKKNVSVR